MESGWFALLLLNVELVLINAALSYVPSMYIAPPCPAVLLLNFVCVKFNMLYSVIGL